MAAKRKKEPVGPPRGAAAYSFRISAFTPRTMPLARLAEYLGHIARVLGEPKSVHLSEVASGSTMPLVWVEREAAPKVRERAEAVRHGTGPRDALEGFETINRMLLQDNATGVLREKRRGRVVLNFPGRKEAADIYFSKQAATLTGSLQRVGGSGESIPLLLATETGATVSGIEADRDLAKRLAAHLFEVVRLSGQGTWERDAEGVWVLRHFRVQSFELLEDLPLSAAVERLRANAGDLAEDAYDNIQMIRHGGEIDGGH